MAFASHREFSKEKKRKLDEQGEDIAKKSRLGISEQPLNASSTSQSIQPTLFNGFILYFDGYTGSQSRLQLRESVLIRGGKVKDKLEPAVTHIIADRIIDSKLMKLKKPVVKPDWILKCIQGGALIPIREYRVVLGGMSKTLSMFRKNPVHENAGSGALIEQSAIDNIGGVLSCEENALEFIESDHESKVDTHSMYSYLQRSIDRKSETQKKIELNPNPSRFPDRQSNPSDKWIKQNSSTAPDFIKRYFQSSRLHHISTQKLMLRDYLAELLLAKPKRSLTSRSKKYIFHVDMDCFFVSVSIRNRPELLDKPVAVAHATNTSSDQYTTTSPSKSAQASTSEISSCNYPARAFGISAGMVVGKAKLLCADLVVLPYDFKLYELASKGLYEALVEFSSNIQAVSCDEAFLEIECEDDRESNISVVYQAAERIRARVLEVTGCNASVGISSNTLLARLATKKAKPNNAYYLAPSNVDAYIATLSVRELPGIGRKIQEKLESKFMAKTCLELRGLSKEVLKNEFGDKVGISLYEYSRGVDEKKLENKERQSVGAEINWGVRFETDVEVIVFLEELCGEAVDRLKAAKMQTRSITLKIMKRKTSMEAYKVLGHGDCGTTYNKRPYSRQFNSIEVVV